MAVVVVEEREGKRQKIISASSFNGIKGRKEIGNLPAWFKDGETSGFFLNFNIN